MRTACYSRYSSDNQRQTSLDDQVRECRDYALAHGWTWQDTQVYTDAAISASSVDGRPGLDRLLTASAAQPRPFDVLLVDDSSRVARDLADALRIVQRLTYAGVRVIYISQGIDSASEQHETLIAVHGLVDALYLREMSSKIKRGLKGQLLRGLATGSVTYGYRTIRRPGDDGADILIDEAAAPIIRQIFAWYADGIPVARMLERLHDAAAPPPQGAAASGGWRAQAIRRMLANPRYRGLLVWGRTRTEREPGRRKRRQLRLPPSEWQTLARPDLQIIDDVLWERVQQRRRAERAQHQSPGLLRGKVALIHGRGLFSGFLACGVCGGSIVLVSRHTAKGTQYAYYGCGRGWNHGRVACTNKVTARREDVERTLLAVLQDAINGTDAVTYVAQRVAALRAEAARKPSRRDTLTQQLETAQQRVRHLVTAIEQGAASETLLRTLHQRETEVARLAGALALIEEEPETPAAVVPIQIARKLADVAATLAEASDRTRALLAELQVRIVLEPVYDVPAGERPYLRAAGEDPVAALLPGLVFPTAGRPHRRLHGSRKGFRVEFPAPSFRRRRSA